MVRQTREKPLTPFHGYSLISCFIYSFLNITRRWDDAPAQAVGLRHCRDFGAVSLVGEARTLDYQLMRDVRPSVMK